MYEGKTIGALLLMGGEGQRFGSTTPKQFHLLAGKKVYLYTLEALLSSAIFDEILLVCHPDWMELVHTESGQQVIEGGATRQASSYRGLKALSPHVDIVLIHDAVRPFVSERILCENVAKAIEHGAVDTCIPSADTLVHAPDRQTISSIPLREHYLRGQTPQTFRKEWILEAHEKGNIENASDDCRLLLALGKPIQIVLGEEANLKITTELDLLIAEQILARQLDLAK